MFQWLGLVYYTILIPPVWVNTLHWAWPLNIAVFIQGLLFRRGSLMISPHLHMLGWAFGDITSSAFLCSVLFLLELALQYLLRSILSPRIWIKWQVWLPFYLSGKSLVKHFCAKYYKHFCWSFMQQQVLSYSWKKGLKIETGS